MTKALRSCLPCQQSGDDLIRQGSNCRIQNYILKNNPLPRQATSTRREGGCGVALHIQHVFNHSSHLILSVASSHQLQTLNPTTLTLCDDDNNNNDKLHTPPPPPQQHLKRHLPPPTLRPKPHLPRSRNRPQSSLPPTPTIPEPRTHKIAGTPSLETSVHRKQPRTFDARFEPVGEKA